MAAESPLPWRQRPLHLFPDADPRVWASLRKRAVDLVLNADFGDLAALRELTRTLSEDLGHGAVCHDQDWARLREDLEAVRQYVLSSSAPIDRYKLALHELNELCQVVYTLDAGFRSTCSTLTATDTASTPQSPRSIRTIAAEVFWTVQFLRDHDSLEVRRCRREECGRWFVDLKGYTESCSDECRIAYAQGR